MAFTSKVEPDKASLTIGDDYKKTNRIAFTISLQGDEVVWVSLQVPLGESGLLRQPEDANDVEVIVDGRPMPRSDRNDPKEWWLVDADNGVKIDPGKPTNLSVSINNVLCRASAGDSKLSVIVSGTSGDGPSQQITVAKAKPTSQGQDQNPILYFIAEPTYVIGKGDVTLRWEVVGDDKPTLDTERGQSKPDKPPTTDSPSRTWTYYLRLGNARRDATVNVLSADHWYPVTPLGKDAFPSVIFDPAEGRTTDALYAIFVAPSANKSGRKSVLCRSKNGITDWEVIDEQVPEGMESSPGVRLKDRLWLIGGSSVDPARTSNRVVSYALDRKPTSGRSRRSWQEANVSDVPARMGHACVIVNDNTIWMLGGIDQHHLALNDVWSLSIGTDGTLKAAAVPVTTPFTPRCMASASTFAKMVWVCGGVSSPNGNPLNDIWTTPLPGSPNVAWKLRVKPKQEPEKYIVENAIGTGAASCAGKLNVITTKRTGGPAWSIAQAMRTLDADGMKDTADYWPSAKPPELPANLRSNWTSTPHSVAAVSFGNHLYLRYLHRNALYGELTGWPLFVRV